MTTAIPTIAASSVPALTREQMVEVDRLMIEVYGIQLIQMMENAGLQLARLARYLAEPSAQPVVVVIAGRGNNGGGGLAAARRLSAWGADVTVVLADEPAAFEGVPRQQLDILRQMRVTMNTWDQALPSCVVLVDALIGYGLTGSPRGVAADIIAAINASDAKVVSLDVPSGLDVDLAEAPALAVRAAATLTLALPKVGLLDPGASPFVGELYLADISVPPSLYQRMGLGTPSPFAGGQLVRLAG